MYLRGRRFTLFTDHKPLEYLSTVHTETLNRQQQQLLGFDFDIWYKEGKDNTAADALSQNTAGAGRRVGDAETGTNGRLTLRGSQRIPAIRVRSQCLSQDGTTSRKTSAMLFSSGWSGVAYPQAQQTKDQECHPSTRIYAQKDSRGGP